MVNRIRKFADGIPVPSANSGSIGIGYKDDSLQVNVGAQGTEVLKHVQLVGEDYSPNVADGASVVLTASQAGSTVRLDLAASAGVTLPSAASAGKGARFTFIVEALPSSGSGHRINVASGDGVGGAGLTYTNDADLLLAVATDALGDFVTVESDGLADWHIVAIKGTWSKV